MGSPHSDRLWYLSASHMCSLEQEEQIKEIIETGIGCLPLLSRLSPSKVPYNVTFPRDTGGTLVCRLLMTLWFFFFFFNLICLSVFFFFFFEK